MKTRLTAAVPVKQVAAMAEVAFLEPRPELVLLCSAVAGERSPGLTPDVVGRVLPGLSSRARWNLVRWCSYLGLCDDAGALTARGREVASGGHVPLPEEGVYRFWVADHPVCGTRVLHVERAAPDSSDWQFNTLSSFPFPSVVGPSRTWHSLVDDGQVIILRKLLEEGNRQASRVEAERTCQLHWDWDFLQGTNRWTLQGTLPRTQGQNAPLRHAGESVPSLDLAALFGQWIAAAPEERGRWEPAERRLLVPFDGLDERGRETFLTDKVFSRVAVPGRGEYSQVRVQDVPLGPLDGDAARQWALARWRLRVSREVGYLSRLRSRTLFEESVRDTPLAPHKPAIPSHAESLRDQDHDGTRTSFWRLAAPVDLAPVPVEPALLEGGAVSPEQAARPALRRVVVTY